MWNTLNEITKYINVNMETKRLRLIKYTNKMFIFQWQLGKIKKRNKKVKNDCECKIKCSVKNRLSPKM